MADLVSHGPKMDRTQDSGLYSKFLDWKEECNPILERPLKKKSAQEKANYLRLLAGSIGRKHINSLKLSEENLKKPSYLFDRIEEYCKPKSNPLLAATELKRLEQGDMSLPEFITKTTLLVDSCTYPSQARDRILRDAIVLGIKSEKAYYKCVKKGSVTLEEALEIVQSEDSTQCQVEASRQQTQIRTETDVHKFQARQSPLKGGAKQKKQRQPKQQSQDHGVRRKSCFMCGATPWHQCKDCPAKNTKWFKCEKFGHYTQVYCSKKAKQLHEMQTALNRLQIQQPVQQHAQPQIQECVQQHAQGYEFVDCIPSVTMHMLKTVKVKSINCLQSNPHIRPAWLSLEPNSQYRS